MFVLVTLVDTIRVPPSLFLQSPWESIHQEIDKKYPNRVIMDVGLVICRFGDAMEISDGICAPGDGGAHYEAVFQLIVFRPFVEEICVGTIVESNEEGVRVSVGEFFQDIYLPAYWMLKPSHYDAPSGLWVWTPTYEDEEDDDDGEIDKDVKREQEEPMGEGGTHEDHIPNGHSKKEPTENHFEMPLGAQIRFRVKAINFTQVTSSAKGLQATTNSSMSARFFPGTSEKSSHHATTTSTAMTTTSTTNGNRGANTATTNDVVANDTRPVRKRSISIDLTDSSQIPPCMNIIASICEDGLGLVSWWATANTNETEEQEFVEEGEAEAEGGNDPCHDYNGMEQDLYFEEEFL